MSEDRRQEDRRKGIERRQGDRRQNDRRAKPQEEKGFSVSLPLFITIMAVVAIVFITAILIMVCRYEKAIKNLENQNPGEVTELVLPSGNMDTLDASNITDDSESVE